MRHFIYILINIFFHWSPHLVLGNGQGTRYQNRSMGSVCRGS